MKATPHLLACALILMLPGCEFPRDAAGTLEHTRGGVLRVGWTERPPWVVADQGTPSGIEPALIVAFAQSLDARVEWLEGAESSLAEALKARRIDVLIGGHTSETPWKRHGAPTLTYSEAKLVIAARAGAAPPRDRDALKGRPVSHHPRRPDLAAYLSRLGATPTLRAAPDLALIYAFERNARDPEPTSIVIASEAHVMLVPPGESRFLLELDRFLTRHGGGHARAPAGAP